MPTLFDPNLAEPLPLPKQDSWPESSHKFDNASVWAVRAAIVSGRPLLLRGEPGIGKSQLARAVAVHLRVPFLYHVVDERSERDELLYSYDAVARLAEAQVSALSAKEEPETWRKKLAEAHFIRPGVLWWAFNWADAQAQLNSFNQHCHKGEPPTILKDQKGNPVWASGDERVCGPVVLVDEIDKADPSVPNGLLESLGNNGFKSVQLGRSVELVNKAKPPLVIITTNEERELPAAFLRRCLVLQMPFPPKNKSVEEFLIHDRARVFWREDEISTDVCKEIITQLLAEREVAKRDGLAVPGAAEFLDIARVLVGLYPGDQVKQLDTLKEISSFALKKNLDDAP